MELDSKEVDCMDPLANGLAAEKEARSLADVDTQSEVVEDPYAKLPDVTTVLDVSLVSNSIKKFIDVKPSMFGNSRDSFELWATNDKYLDCDSSKTGKWMLFVHRRVVDALWSKLLASIISGALWKAVLLYNINYPDPRANPETFPIMIFTVDYADLDDVIRVLDYLETTGLNPDKCITYKTDDQTRSGIYRWRHNGRPWIYSSLAIRSTRKKMYKSNNIPIIEFEKSKKFY